MQFARAGRGVSAAGVIVATLLVGRLALAAAPGVLGAYVRGPEVLIPGTQAAVRVATHRATSAADSRPAAQVQVQATLSGSGRSQVLWTAVSDAQGRVEAHFQVPAWPPGKYALAVVSQHEGERYVQTHPVQLQPSGKLLLQSDKPLYQPGQTVHLRAVAMRTHDGHPLTQASVQFELHDARNNRVFTATQKLSAFGIAAADAVLAEGILLGTYQATAELLGAAGVEPAQLPVEVSRYVLPKMRLAVRPDRPYYRPGERVKLALDGRYFTDKPVAGGVVTIEAALAAEPANKKTKASSGLAPALPGTRLPTLHGTLDAAGQLTLELELPKALPADESRLVLDAVVTDSARQRQARRQEVAVFAEPLRLDVVAEAGQLVLGLQNTVYVVAAYPDGSPAVAAAVELQLRGQTLGQTQTQTTDELGISRSRPSPPGPPLRPASRVRAEQLIRFLVGSKDPLGNFTATQATVRTLKALLTYQESVTGLSRGTLTVLVDGREAAQQKIVDDNAHVIDLASAATGGSHQVALRYDGTGSVGYQPAPARHADHHGRATTGSGRRSRSPR